MHRPGPDADTKRFSVDDYDQPGYWTWWQETFGEERDRPITEAMELVVQRRHEMNSFDRIDMHVNRIEGSDHLSVFGYVCGNGSGPKPIPVVTPQGTSVIEFARDLKRRYVDQFPATRITLFLDTGGVESIVRSE